MSDETDDELARRRGINRPDAAPSSPKARQPSQDVVEKRPPLWRWFSTQVAHSDPAKSAAARAIRERWDLPATRFSKIDRSLTAEDSAHLLPFRQLLDEYRLTYEIEGDDGDFARETGVAGLLVPFSPETCESCTREAVPGTGKCGRHGGQWLSPADMADVSHRIHDKLVTMSETALRVLQDLMDNGRSEQVRMMAATAVLDRAGVGPHMNVNHTGEVTVSESDRAANELRGRLDRIAESMVKKGEIEAMILSRGEPADIVDADVVPESEAVEA